MAIINKIRLGIIYCALCLINGKRYIGQAGERQGKLATVLDAPEKIFKARRREHEKAARNRDNNRQCRAFYNALRKHGVENFQWEIVATVKCPQSELDELERHYIRHFNSRKPPLGNGYNLTNGGEGGAHHPETCERIAAAHRGKEKSEKHRANLAAARRGKKLSAEMCKIWSAVQKKVQNRPDVKAKNAARNRGMNNHMFGKKHTEKSLKIMSEARRAQWQDPEYRANHAAAMNSPKVKAKISAGAKKREERKRAAKRNGNLPLFV